jgi:hypothetical protein
MAYDNDDDDSDVLAKPATVTGAKYVIPKDAQVLPPLASQCKCELAVNEEGLAMVIYTKTLPEGIHWAEYDMDLSILTFVTWSGDVMELGMKIHPPFRPHFKKAKEILMVQMTADGTEIMAIYPADMVVRNIGL